MRTQNHLEIKQKCEAVIPKLFEKHRLGTINSVKVDKEGWVNPCFFVDGRYAVRFNARDPNLPKFQREKIVFDLLKEQGLPVPQKVLLDDSRNEVEFDVLISSFLEGQNLEASWNPIDSNAQKSIAFHAGQLLKQIHSLKFNFFGEISGKGPLPQTDSWSQYLKAKLKFHLDEAAEFDLFKSEHLERVWSVFENGLSNTNGVKTAKLVHVDYHFGNLLYLNNMVSGILDFEWSFAGDPLYDVSRWTYEEEICKGSQKPFLEGYGFTGLSDLEMERIKVYQMIKNIELCPVAKKHFGEGESVEYLETTINYINKVFDKI